MAARAVEMACAAEKELADEAVCTAEVVHTAVHMVEEEHMAVNMVETQHMDKPWTEKWKHWDTFEDQKTIEEHTLVVGNSCKATA